MGKRGQVCSSWCSSVSLPLAELAIHTYDKRDAEKQCCGQRSALCCSSACTRGAICSRVSAELSVPVVRLIGLEILNSSDLVLLEHLQQVLLLP